MVGDVNVSRTGRYNTSRLHHGLRQRETLGDTEGGQRKIRVVFFAGGSVSKISSGGSNANIRGLVPQQSKTSALERQRLQLLFSETSFLRYQNSPFHIALDLDHATGC